MKVNIQKYPKGNTARRIDVQIDGYDTWSADATLAHVILPVLLQFRASRNNSVPNDFTRRTGDDIDRNYCFDFIADDESRVFEECCEKWNEVLDKMIWSFYQISLGENYDSKYHHGQMDMGWKQIEHHNPITGKVEPMYTIVDNNPDEHWYDRVGHELHEKRIQEGLELFGRHLRSLWD